VVNLNRGIVCGSCRCNFLAMRFIAHVLLAFRVHCHSLLCRDCLSEPLETEYFGGTPSGEPPRVHLTAEAFDVAVTSGSVLLIENATRGAALEGWTCEMFANAFPEARMRREYDWERNPRDENLQRLGDASWTSAQVRGEDAKERSRLDPASPPFAPFYWGVREHRGGGLGSTSTLLRVQKLIEESVPAFMDSRNAHSMFDNAEFWMGAKGTGARAHMDSHCISTVSFVLSGQRRWRVGPVPRMPRGAGRSRLGDVVFDDGVAYRLETPL